MSADPEDDMPSLEETENSDEPVGDTIHKQSKVVSIASDEQLIQIFKQEGLQLSQYQCDLLNTCVGRDTGITPVLTTIRTSKARLLYQK